MTCGLCLNDFELCDSHIVPEFLYKSLYSREKHKFVQLSGPPKVRKWQKGFRQKMLCRNCEDKLNQWETYVSKVMFGGAEICFEKLQDAILVQNVGYEKFKLFQLSLIWRAGVSKLPQFSNVNLGPHEEKLRCMIINENPGRPSDYGCFMLLTPSYFDLTSQMMMLPQETRFGDHRCYMFLMAGLTWVFFVSSHTAQLPQKEKMFLRLDNILPIIIENSASKTFFEKTVNEWKESDNLGKALKKFGYD